MGMVAFSLSFMLDSVVFGFNGLVAKLSESELVVSHRSHGGGGLPLAYRDSVADVEGVAGVWPVNGFSASHHTRPRTLVPVSGIEPDFLGGLTDSFAVASEHLAQFKDTRNGAIIGEDVAREWGWKVGDVVPLQSNMLRKDGSSDWQFMVVGTYRLLPDLPSTNFYVRFSYVDAARATGAGRADRFFLALGDVDLKDRVIAEIDGMFLNSSNPTRTISLKDRALSQRQQMGNMHRLIASVTNSTFLAILIVMVAVSTQSSRERVLETAVMRALGFGLASVVAIFMIEAGLCVFVGLFVGLGIASVVMPLALDVLNLTPLGISGDLLLRNVLVGVAMALSIVICSVLASRSDLRDVLEIRR